MTNCWRVANSPMRVIKVKYSYFDIFTIFISLSLFPGHMIYIKVINMSVVVYKSNINGNKGITNFSL